MAPQSAKQLLDQLMGPNRNELQANKKLKRHWSDQDVCKNYLVSFCPYDLFIGTKADMGECKNRHADILKEQYEKSDKYGTMGYEEKFFEFLENIVKDCDRKISKARERLEYNKVKNRGARDRAEAERHTFLDNKIKHLLAKSEALGNQGNVSEAHQVSQVIEKLMAEKQAPADATYLMTSDLSMEREMDICQVCSALILVGDTHLRIEDHVQGRQHAGYEKIRNQFEKMEIPYWKKEEINKPQIIKEIQTEWRKEDDYNKRDKLTPKRKDYLNESREKKYTNRSNESREKNYRNRSNDSRDRDYRKRDNHKRRRRDYD